MNKYAAKKNRQQQMASIPVRNFASLIDAIINANFRPVSKKWNCLKDSPKECINMLNLTKNTTGVHAKPGLPDYILKEACISQYFLNNTKENPIE